MQNLIFPRYCWYHLSFVFHMHCVSVVWYLYYYYYYYYYIAQIFPLCLTTHSLTWIECAVELQVWLVG